MATPQVLASLPILGGTTTAGSSAYANYIPILNGSGLLDLSFFPSSIVGDLQYQGTWNANTNTPTLISSTGTKGFFYVVATAGTTTLDGISIWNIGDWAIFNGTTWNKLDGAAAPVTSVAGRTGAVTLTSNDLTDATSIGKSLITSSTTSNARSTIRANNVYYSVTVNSGLTSLIGSDGLNNVNSYTFQAGSGAYTYVINLSAVSAANGDVIQILANLPASTNPTLQVYDQASTTLLTNLLSNGTATAITLSYVFNGSNWVAFNTGALLAYNNLSDLTSTSTARTNLGLTALATTTPGTGVVAALGNSANITGGFALAPSYSSSFTYSAGALAIGSDGNTYRALGSTTGNDPTTDAGTNWELALVKVNTTLNIPSRFSTIATAWTFLKNATIVSAATATMKVADGTYNLGTVQYIFNHPQGANIQLIGNTTTPANCVLNVTGIGFTPSGYVQNNWGFICVNQGHSFGLIDGFTMNGPGHAASNFYGTMGILASDHSFVALGNHVIINNFYSGWAAFYHSEFNGGSGNTVTGGGDGNIWAYMGSHIYADHLTTSGASTFYSQSGVLLEHGSSAFLSNLTTQNNGVPSSPYNGNGILLTFGSTVWCQYMTNSGNNIGISVGDGCSFDDSNATYSSIGTTKYATVNTTLGLNPGTGAIAQNATNATYSLTTASSVNPFSVTDTGTTNALALATFFQPNLPSNDYNYIGGGASTGGYGWSLGFTNASTTPYAWFANNNGASGIAFYKNGDTTIGGYGADLGYPIGLNGNTNVNGTLSINGNTLTALATTTPGTGVVAALGNTLSGPGGVYGLGSDGGATFPYGISQIGATTGMASSAIGNVTWFVNGGPTGYSSAGDSTVIFANLSSSSSNSGAGFTNSVATVAGVYGVCSWSAGTNTLTLAGASTTQNGTLSSSSTAVTLSASNSSIAVGQWVSGTNIAYGTRVTAISGTSLTLSITPTGNGVSLLSFTPYVVNVGSNVTSIAVGQMVMGKGIYNGTTVSSISGTTITLTPPTGATYATYAANTTNAALYFFYPNTSQACTWSSLGTTVTLSATNPAIAAGQFVSEAGSNNSGGAFGTYITAGTTVVSVTGTTVVLSAPVLSGSGATLFFCPPALYYSQKGNTGYNYNGLVGCSFNHVPCNRIAPQNTSGLIAGNAMLVFNENDVDMRGLAICAPNLSGFDSGNYSLAYFDLANGLFRVPYWVSRAYQPSDYGWLDAFSVNPATGAAKVLTSLTIGNTGISAGSQTPYLDIEAQGPRIQLHNTNDTLACQMISTNNSFAFGMFNPSGSTLEGIAANTLQYVFGGDYTGKCGSVTNTLTGYGGSALTYRNILDDGSGNFIMPYNISTANNQLLLSAYPGGGVDNSCSIILRHGSYNVNDYYVYGGNASSGYGHQFWTGGAQGSQTVKLGIYNDKTVINNNLVLSGTNSLTASQFLSPTGTPSAVNGTNVTTTVTGTNQAGTIQIVVAGGATTGVISTITLANSLAYPNKAIMTITPANATTANLVIGDDPYITGTTTTVVLNTSGTGIPVGTYLYNYIISGY